MSLIIYADNIARSSVKSYKVMTQKDRWFGGKFDPDQLEKALNAYAEEGYECRAIATASIPGAFGAREELIFILERDAS